MLPLVTRVLKRLAILLVGAFFIYLAVWRVFPFFNNRVPVALALFITYVAMAYVIIPVLFRVFRLFYNPVHLPLYCTTPDGFASDPINIALVGSRPDVITAMAAAGWVQADAKTMVNLLRQVVFGALSRSYPHAPVSTLYLFGRKQDLAFEKEIAGSRGYRHHVRFWAADTSLAKEFGSHERFWQRFHRTNRRRPNAQFWVGAASKDVGFAPIRHNAQLTHMIDPNTDSERHLILKDLKRAQKLRSHHTVMVHAPFSLRNPAWRGFLRSDGQIIVCDLK
jgi:hypothetical protein